MAIRVDGYLSIVYAIHLNHFGGTSGGQGSGNACRRHDPKDSDL